MSRRTPEASSLGASLAVGAVPAGPGALSARGARGASKVAPSTVIPGNCTGCADPLAGMTTRAASTREEKLSDDERMTPLRTAKERRIRREAGSERAAAWFGRKGAGCARPSASAVLFLLAPETSPARPSTRTQSRRHYGDPLAGAPRVGDGRLVPAGLLACGSMRITPAFPPIGSAVALGSDARRLQLRGQPRL